MKKKILFIMLGFFFTLSCIGTSPIVAQENKPSLSGNHSCPDAKTQLSSLLSFYEDRNFRSIGIFTDFILSEHNTIIHLSDPMNNIAIEALWIAKGYVDIYSLTQGDRLLVCGYTAVITSPTQCFHTKSELICSGNPPTCNQRIIGDLEKCNVGKSIILILYAKNTCLEIDCFA